MNTKIINLLVLFFMFFQVNSSVIHYGKTPLFVKTIRTTCLKAYPSSTNCIYALPYPKIIPTVTGYITPSKHIQVRYYVSGKWITGWVSVYAVQLIYPVH